MRLLPSLLCLLVILHVSYAPPVSPEKKEEPDSEIKDDLEEYMEYHRYLKEVVQALESDPDFRERLEKADEEDVRSGKIAEQLDFVNHNVRTKLDEIKRRELERLRHLATMEYELTNNLDTKGKVSTNEHLDHNNPHTFEIEDLRKLIKKTTADLEAADKQRKEEFKEYEMQKEFEKNQKLETMDETHKKEYMEKLKQEEEAKKHHKPLRHPVTREQLLEIWKNGDRMDAKDFDPKVFFMMHDVDGNGVWDADEVKALFIKELDKLYAPNGPNKDLHERAEEMERMREHVFRENDKNRDGLIDFSEFMTETQKEEFNQDQGWKSIDENQIYTQQEYDEFQRRRHEELRYLQQRGLVDANGHPVPGAEHQINQAHQQFQAYYQQQLHQQQLQAQYPGQQYYPHPGQQNPQGYAPQGQMPHYQQAQAYHQPQGYQPPPQQGQFQQPQGQYQQPQGQYQQPQGQYQPPQGQQQYQGQPAPGQNQGMPATGQNQGMPATGQNQGMPATGQNQGMPAPGQNQAQLTQQGQYQGQQPQPVQNSQYQPRGQVAQQPQQNVNLNQGQAPVQQAQKVSAGQNQAQGQGQAPAQPAQPQPLSPNLDQASQGQAPPAQAQPAVKQ